PCVGVSFGIDRMFAAMEILGLFTEEGTTTTQVLVTVFGSETLPASFALATALRQAGIHTETYADPKGLGPQLAFASKKGIALVCIVGPDEVARGEVILRDLRTGQQRSVPRAEAATQALAILGGADGDGEDDNGGAVAITEEC
ncbi:MAG: hypothetical protein IVW57_12090, partial [Ktedonobacterales bacterium]|nr:hypothetical protein [Ktedonobacterales bacterium]